MAELNNTSTGQWSETDASNTSASPDGWPSGTYFNQVEPIGRSTMGAIKRFWDRINGTVTTTGSSNAYVYTPVNTSYPTAYKQGETYSFKANFTNTGAATININGLGAINIYQPSSNGPSALAGGEIQSGQMVMLQYDGTEMQMISPSSNSNSATGSGGFINKFRNGTMNVWQRGTSGTITAGTPAIGPDGWYISSTSANITYAQVAGRLLTRYSLQLTGNTSVSDAYIAQNIESFESQALTSKTITVSAQIYNGTGSAIVPTISTGYASVKDNFSTVTADLAATNLQSCANGAWTQVAYTFVASASVGLGYRVNFDFGSTINSGAKTIQIAELDIRVTTGISTGLNSSPPLPELRNMSTETTQCQRYYNILGTGANGAITFLGVVTNGSYLGGAVCYPTMRTSPTGAIVGTWTVVNCSQPSLNAVGVSCLSILAGSTSTVPVAANFANNTAASQYITLSAEL